IRRENARAVVGFAVRVGGRGDGRDRAVVGFAVRVGGRGDGRDRGVGFAVARAGIARARVGVRPPGRARPARRRLRGAEGGGGVEGGGAAAREVGGVVGGAVGVGLGARGGAPGALVRVVGVEQFAQDLGLGGVFAQAAARVELFAALPADDELLVDQP